MTGSAAPPRRWRIFGSASPQRRRTYLGVLALVVAGVIAAVVALTVGTETTAAAQDRPGPVVLVPGYGGDTASLADIAAALRAQGRTAQILSLPDGGTGDLQGQADVLQRLVAHDLAAGAPSVDVVGYSAGGVTTRLWASEGHHASTARRIVTIGSPQHGTEVASGAGLLLGAACTGGCAELQPDSALLGQLNAGDETPNGPEWLSLWSTADQTVVPPDSASLQGADDIPLQRICPTDHVSHSQEPRDPAVIGLVLDALGTGPLPTPGTVTCAGLQARGAPYAGQ